MKNIHESVSKLLTSKLKNHTESKLNKETCTSIYQDIFDTFVSVFEESKINIGNEAMNIVSQMYYDSITVNGGQELDPNIFEKRANPKNVETKELAMLATMFSSTPFAPIFISEIKKRS